MTKESITNKKDHFVPRFLLKRFAIERSGLIFVYKKRGRPKRRSIKKHAGNEVDFYLGRDAETKNPSKISDDVYKEIEKGKHAPQIVAKILKQDGVLDIDAKEESILATFIAHQLTRTKKFRTLVNKTISYLLLHGLIEINDLGSKEKVQEIIVKNKHKITRKQVLGSNLVTKSILDGVRGQELFIAIQVAQHIVQEIYQKNFHTIVAPEEYYFVLSDDPVCIMGRDDDLLEITSLWDFSRTDGYTFILPISPRKAFAFGNVYASYQQIDDKKIAESIVVMVNSISVNNAGTEFYSHTDKFWDDYKNDLITPGRLKSYNKLKSELKNNLLKRVLYETKYRVWKLKKFLQNIF